MFLESAVALFLLGATVGFAATTAALWLWLRAQNRRTRREIVRVNQHTESALVLREAFFSVACSCPSPQTFMSSCPVHGLDARKLRAVE